MTVMSLTHTKERIKASSRPLLVTALRTQGGIRFDSSPNDTAYAAEKIASKSKDIIGIFKGYDGAEKFIIEAGKFR